MGAGGKSIPVRHTGDPLHLIPQPTVLQGNSNHQKLSLPTHIQIISANLEKKVK